jgi:hypothetical protein
VLGVRVCGSKASVLHWNGAETSSSHPDIRPHSVTVQDEVWVCTVGSRTW